MIGLFLVVLLGMILTGLAWIGGERPLSPIIVPLENPAPLNPAPLKSAPSA